MTKCEKCDTWMTSDAKMCSACTDTMGQIRDKVDERRNPCPMTDAAADARTLRVDVCPECFSKERYYKNRLRDAYSGATKFCDDKVLDENRRELMTEKPAEPVSTTPRTDAFPTRSIERLISEAKNRKGMVVGMPHITAPCDHIEYILARSRHIENELAKAEARAAELQANLDKEIKFSEAISKNCNDTANERNALWSKLAAERVTKSRPVSD